MATTIRSQPRPSAIRVPVLAGILCLLGGPGPTLADQANPRTQAESHPPRSFRTFLPKPGDTADAPSCQVVQLLLDRQEKGDFDSYMIQVLFRGKPPRYRSYRVLEDRIVIDFYDTGKPGLRLLRVRGGVIEASSLEELFYRDGPPGAGNPAPAATKRMVRMILFTHAHPELKFRDTLDRTLIHFRLIR